MTIQTIHAEGKIDIHNRRRSFLTAFSKLQKDQDINWDNKKIIISFIKDCLIGKTVVGKSKKKIGHGRCLKYISILKRLSVFFNKSFNIISQEDMEYFIQALENDSYLSIKKVPYSSETKADIKKTIKKFWKWKDGNNRQYPELVEWIDTYVTVKEIPALLREDIEKLIETAYSVKLKAIIMVLFDSGARIEELLNVRLKKEHISYKEKIGSYVIRIEHSKTKPRTISVPLSTTYLRKWLQEHPNRDDPLAQLFPISYDNLRMQLHRIGKKALGKRVNPHLLRHSSVTFYANKITNRFKLCYRYGWAMSSKEVDRYLDREGLFEEDISEIVKQDEISSFKNENKKLKEELGILKDTSNKALDSSNISSNILKMIIEKQHQMSIVLEKLSGQKFDIVLPEKIRIK